MSGAVLTGLTVYPVKGCRGISIEHAQLDARGITHDRAWMMIDRDGAFRSQRKHPQLALVIPHFDGDYLILEMPGHGHCAIPLLEPRTEPRTVRVHEHLCLGLDEGDAAATWASAVLGEESRIVRMPQWFPRNVGSRRHPLARTGFADAFPFLLIGEASLGDLNARIVARDGEPVRMDRFRPNLVVDGCVPYAEDSWVRFRIGGIEFIGEKPCTRCPVTTVNQQTAERGKEPLATLAMYRTILVESDGGTKRKTIFGMYVTHRGVGELVVGMPVEVLEGT
ncbi:MAG: MOSC domain-containing protein [bacterium]|nr:MOSC domain-containing protein [bacterium]